MNPYTILVPGGFKPTDRPFTGRQPSHGLNDQISRLAFKAVVAVEGAIGKIIQPRGKSHA